MNVQWLLEQVEDPEHVTLDYRDAPEVKAVCEYVLQLEEQLTALNKQAERERDYKGICEICKERVLADNLKLRKMLEDIHEIAEGHVASRDGSRLVRIASLSDPYKEIK